ncbi:Threonine--tRNA ligase 1, cytoplasmic [Dermatophagoides farinae]|uniref:threonine--tRNA ligase n=1 Tax=Dermatophagoides farinae TaxID=6954 RepID=A0A922HPG4_DERFA|nr:Threonine--tRNA ligase 1, cytoplasmic [Dermatophagoides farinae]
MKFPPFLTSSFSFRYYYSFHYKFPKQYHYIITHKLQYIQSRKFHRFSVNYKMAAEVEQKISNMTLNDLNPQPDFIAKRLELWEQFKKRYEAELADNQNKSIEITINAKNKDGETREIKGNSWKISPIDVARQICPKSFCDTLVISKVNGALWDLERPLEANCNLEFLTFDSLEGKQVFWHSTAHILGEALEKIYGGHLCYGPPIENGFYYDMYSSGCCSGDIDLSAVTQAHYPSIENSMKSICNEKQPFERLELTKDELLEMFAYNQFKVRILKEKVKDPKTTVYRCGSLIDLCRGPHVRHTGFVKAFKVTKSSSSYWEGKADAEALQRVYGISFPDSKQLKEWQRFQEEAAKRDHRKIGREQGLFFFHELSPGSCFFTPRGAFIYNTLIDYIRSEYRKRGFQEVVSPNIFNMKLWHISGHAEHYADNMFQFELEKEKFGLKPMNCPGHCLIFDSDIRSWRDLPFRLADFGVLHRNELSGALTGLTRVRRFQQDDAHIFCTIDQINKEIRGALDFLNAVYSLFGFTFDLCLSTRPEGYLGELAVWDQAEKALADALNESGIPWKLNPGDGAFYGPKIDITINDALRRPHQCATIQLDFQLPIRFNLNYSAEDGTKKRPVIIHRAILGSVERFIAILTENFAGKWPFWLSPRQAIVLPVGPSCNEYAEKVRQQLHDAGFQSACELDPGLTINKKVRNAQLAQFNFILVVGDKESANNTVNVRTRDNKIHGEISILDLIEKFQQFKKEKTINAEEIF